jgi:hypothetical protein
MFCSSQGNVLDSTILVSEYAEEFKGIIPAARNPLMAYSGLRWVQRSLMRSLNSERRTL